MTTTIGLVEDEAFPDYTIVEADRAEVILDVPDEIAERWTQAHDAWAQAVDEIRTAYRSIAYPTRPDLGAVTPPPYPGRTR